MALLRAEREISETRDVPVPCDPRRTPGPGRAPPIGTRIALWRSASAALSAHVPFIESASSVVLVHLIHAPPGGRALWTLWYSSIASTSVRRSQRQMRSALWCASKYRTSCAWDGGGRRVVRAGGTGGEGGRAARVRGSVATGGRGAAPGCR